MPSEDSQDSSLGFVWLSNGFSRPEIGFAVGLFWLYLAFLALFFIIQIAISHR